jgi:hypothetical protein
MTLTCVRLLQVAAVAALLAHLLIGACLARGYAPQPRVGKCPTVGQLLARGAMTAVVWLAVLGGTEAYPAAAGVLLLVPLWAWSVWVFLWTTHGEAQCTAAVPPAALGSASASLYAVLAAVALPALGVGLGSLLAWCAAVALVTLPVAAKLHRAAPSRVAVAGAAGPEAAARREAPRGYAKLEAGV